MILLVIIFVSNSLVRAAISYRLGEAENRRIEDWNPRLKLSYLLRLVEIQVV